MNIQKEVAIVGSGPAALMAATVVSHAGHRVRVFEKRRGPGWKLLVAGSSGLNITYDSPVPEFVGNYRAGDPSGLSVITRAIESFPPSAWTSFIETELGIGTFKGTSRRYFVEGMKASMMLKRWVELLQSRGVIFEFQRECTGFETSGRRVSLILGEEKVQVDALCLALGGGSWESGEKPLRWPAIFRGKGIAFREFESSNVGFRVDWPPALIEEAEGKPIKNVILRSPRAERSGDLVITRYGLEGTPIYFAGMEGEVLLDLKPDLSVEQVLRKLQGKRENFSPFRRVQKFLGLSDGALALLYHLTPASEKNSLESLTERVKKFPIFLSERQPLDEAISSSGGVEWAEIEPNLMLRKNPGVFLAGEMLDWDAPTGGFLIQNSVSLGRLAGRGILAWLDESS